MKELTSVVVIALVLAALSANGSSGDRHAASRPSAAKASLTQLSAVRQPAPVASDVSMSASTNSQAPIQVVQQDKSAPAAAPAPAAESFSVEKTAETCNACHGPDGNSMLPETPSLAGQTARYIYMQLKDFKEKRRENPLMSPMAANLDKAQMLALAQYYSEKKLQANDFRVAAEKVKLGKAKADEVLCTMCHQGGFLGQNEIPRVAGQRYDYIVKQLKDFKAMKRTNDAGNMASVSKTLKDEDIDALAQYITSLN